MTSFSFLLVSLLTFIDIHTHSVKSTRHDCFPCVCLCMCVCYLFRSSLLLCLCILSFYLILPSFPLVDICLSSFLTLFLSVSLHPLSLSPSLPFSISLCLFAGCLLLFHSFSTLLFFFDNFSPSYFIYSTSSLFNNPFASFSNLPLPSLLLLHHFSITLSPSLNASLPPVSFLLLPCHSSAIL